MVIVLFDPEVSLGFLRFINRITHLSWFEEGAFTSQISVRFESDCEPGSRALHKARIWVVKN
jgi:hypothetical protein